MSKSINSNQLLRALSDVDDKYILEASFEVASKPKAKITRLANPKVLGSLAAIVLAIVGGLIFIKYASNNSSKSEEAAVQHNSVSLDYRGEVNAPAFSPETAAGVAEIEEDFYDSAIEDAVCDGAEPPAFNIVLPEELSEATISDYEYGSDFERVSFFDESGELLLEIECCSYPIDDVLFQNFDAEQVSNTLTLYFDGDVYVGAMFIRDNYYMIRTPMGVSEDTLLEIIDRF